MRQNSIRKYFLLIVLTFQVVISIVNAQSPSLSWVRGFGSTSDDIGNAITVDPSGNVYTIGNFQGTVDFDPGPGVYTLTALGLEDIFISKLDANGNFVWTKQIGAGGADAGNAITLDASGNIYTTGGFKSVVDFDPGAGTFILTSTSASIDIFVLKLDASGNFVWAKQMGGFLNEFGFGIVTDAASNIFLTGKYLGSVDFDPGPATAYLTSLGNDDIFIVKLNATGNFVWANSIGGSGVDYGYAIALDAMANVYTTGLFQGTVDFDPGVGTYTFVCVGNDDGYISKLDSAGNFIWAAQLAGTSSCAGFGITLDLSGNVYTVGYYRATVDFDPGVGVSTLTNIASGSSIFVSKLDGSGNFIMAKQLGGGAGPAFGYGIALDASNNIYTTGFFNGVVDLDPGTGVSSFTASAGTRDIFVSKLDVNGNFIWAERLGGNINEEGKAIFVDASGNNIHTTGYFQATTDFDPTIGVFNLTSIGNNDIFIHKMGGSTVGIKENETLSQGICIYPNPNNGEFIIQGETEMNLNIINELGQQVQQLNLNSLNNFKANISNLNSGMYFVTRPQGNINKKIVVIK